MRVLHVIPHLDKEMSGPTQSVLRLSESLLAAGVDVCIVCASRPSRSSSVRIVEFSEWPFLARLGFGRFGFSPKLSLWMFRGFHEFDVVHNHGLWAFPNIIAGLAKAESGAALVTSPRGSLQPAALSYSRAKKLLAAPLQLPALTRADCLHATSDMEAVTIESRFPKQTLACIPNGIDVPRAVSDFRARPRRALFLGRLHPIKQVELLLRAWSRLGSDVGWELIIAGDGEAHYVRSLKELAYSLGLTRIEFVGEVGGERKERLFGTARLVVLPSRSENFGMVVAEALARSIPVVATLGTPWKGLDTHSCGWWVAPDEEELAVALRSAFSLPSAHLAEMGARGRRWMLRDFGWDVIAGRMMGLYYWVLGQGDVSKDVVSSGSRSRAGRGDLRPPAAC